MKLIYSTQKSIILFLISSPMLVFFLRRALAIFPSICYYKFGRKVANLLTPAVLFQTSSVQVQRKLLMKWGNKNV